MHKNDVYLGNWFKPSKVQAIGLQVYIHLEMMDNRDLGMCQNMNTDTVFFDDSLGWAYQQKGCNKKQL